MFCPTCRREKTQSWEFVLKCSPDFILNLETKFCEIGYKYLYVKFKTHTHTHTLVHACTHTPQQTTEVSKPVHLISLLQRYNK